MRGKELRKIEVWNCRKLIHWERQGGKCSEITYLQKSSLTSKSVVVPTRVTLLHNQ